MEGAEVPKVHVFGSELAECPSEDEVDLGDPGASLTSESITTVSDITGHMLDLTNQGINYCKENQAIPEKGQSVENPDTRIGPLLNIPSEPVDVVTEQPGSTLFQASRLPESSKEPAEEEKDVEENPVLTALFLAVEEKSLESLQEAIESADTSLSINTPNKHGETILHLAAHGGHLESIRYLRTKGVDLQAKDKLGDTSIHWAAKQGQLQVVEYMKDHGLSIDTQNKAGETSLHVAARYGHIDVVEFLCRAGANVDLQDKFGETVLHNAAWYGLPLPICSLICSSMKNLNLKNKDEETPLHIAASRGHIGCAEVLIQHGANINIGNKRDECPLHLACRRHHVEVAMMLLQAGCQLDIRDQIAETPLHLASREGLLRVVQTLCAYGCTIDVVNNVGLTPLHLGSCAGNIEVVRCLLLSGAEPDCMNKDGLNSEIMALAQGHNDVAELLVKLNLDRRQQCINQLMPTEQPLPRIKVKVFGNSHVGKTTLVDSLRCGYFGSFFRKARSSTSTSTSSARKDVVHCDDPGQLLTQPAFKVAHLGYTRGIDIQMINISMAGDLSSWEFSGYEPYYLIYDHFIGDPNCIHMIVFKLDDPPDVQLAQVLFWLNFLKARIAPMEPIAYGGRQPLPAKVILVATHADKVSCEKNDHGEFVSQNANSMLATVQQQFHADFDITQHVFIMNAHLATTTDIKALRIQLGIAKSEIVQRLPHTNGFLEAAVSALPLWRKVLASFPAVPWPSFVDYIRAKVNLLASEGHLKELMCQLQLVGEMVYIETADESDLVVINPNWLCSDVIGQLLSHDNLAQCRPTGCFTADDFRIMFAESDASDLLNKLLEALEICTQYDIEGSNECEFPCLNFIQAPTGSWEADDKGAINAVYAGLRLQCPSGMSNQLFHLYPRIQVQLRRDALKVVKTTEYNLYQWYHTSMWCVGKLESLISLELSEQVLEIKCRGPQDFCPQLHQFMQHLYDSLKGVIEDCCPGIALERHVLSPTNLKEHASSVLCYSPKDIFLVELQENPSVLFNNNQPEQLQDMLFGGSNETKERVTMGVDLHVSSLSMHARRKLAACLDPPDPMGKDWVVLAVSLGLTPDLPRLDSESDPALSPTDWTLATWSQAQQSTIGMLLRKLHDLGRPDALEAVLMCSSLYEVKDEQDSKEQGTMREVF